MSLQSKNNKILRDNEPKTRRNILQSMAFLGGCGVLTGGIASVGARMAHAKHLDDLDRGNYKYLHNNPENTIYSACLQCHSACSIKCKVVDGVLVKIDGNPYSPQTNIPNVPNNSSLDDGAAAEGKICPKGQAGIETLYDPYRLRKVLKRKPGTKRGENQWLTIDFNKAVQEIVNGGDLFGEGHVEGLKDIYVLKDRSLAKKMSGDAKNVASGKMSVDDFKAKYSKNLDVLIDPDHPDLGPKNNQFTFLAGRIEHGRKEFMKWFTGECFGSINAFEHTTICEQSHHIAFNEMTKQWEGSGWASKGKTHLKPDVKYCEFIIFFGTGFAESNFGPPLLTGLVSEATTDNRLKYAVVDPRLSKSAGKADIWVPIKPGGDAAFAMGMNRWIIENERFDRKFLENANAAAAAADGETSWSTATYLVRIEDGRPSKYLRAKDIGIGSESEFVVSRGGKPVKVDPNDKSNPVEGDLEAEVKRSGVVARTAYSLLKDRALEKSIKQYADISGVDVDTIVDMAKEFTSHGKRAVAEFYRGPVQHANGYYNAQALITLNLLIGNIGWKGGMSSGGGHWHEYGGKDGNPYNMGKIHPQKFPVFGPPSNREKSQYEKFSLFNGYPAKRPWYPLTSNLYQEVIPSAGDGYPYKTKALLLHKGTPVLACPAGHKQIDILRDTKKIPLFICCDIVIGETSMYSDYIIPDTAVWERWGTPHITPAMLVAVSKVRQPVVAPLVETTVVDGVEMPINLEAFLIATAKELDLPGFGKDAFGTGKDFNHQDDWYMKLVANIAMGDKAGDVVPAADAKEMDIFMKARKHLPKTVFDVDRMRKAAGEDFWPHVVHVLNRGGRFEDTTKMYKGSKQAHPYKGLFQIFVEKTASIKNSITGKPFDGLPRVDPEMFANGKPIPTPGGNYPFHMITYKEIFGGHSRTMPPDLWLKELLPENKVMMNRRDGERLGLMNEDTVLLTSPTNTSGSFDLGNGKKIDLTGKIKLIEGIRPGVIAISWHFGHWAYGSNDVTVDGKVVKGDVRRGTGIGPNPLMLEDTGVGNVCLTDPIGGSASFFDTPVAVKRV